MDITANPKRFWSLFNNKGQKTVPLELHYGSSVATLNQRPELFNRYFSDNFTPPTTIMNTLIYPPPIVSLFLISTPHHRKSKG